MALAIESTGYITKVKYIVHDENEDLIFPSRTVGIIRVWNDDTKQPTDFYILLGDYDKNDESIVYNSEVSELDFTYLNNKIQNVFDNSEVNLNLYSIHRRFRMDIFVPQAMIEYYTS